MFPVGSQAGGKANTHPRFIVSATLGGVPSAKPPTNSERPTSDMPQLLSLLLLALFPSTAWLQDSNPAGSSHQKIEVHDLPVEKRGQPIRPIGEVTGDPLGGETGIGNVEEETPRIRGDGAESRQEQGGEGEQYWKSWR